MKASRKITTLIAAMIISAASVCASAETVAVPLPDDDTKPSYSTSSEHAIVSITRAE